MGSEAIVIPIIIDPKAGVAGLKAVGEAASQTNKQFDAGSSSAGKFGNVMRSLSANAFAVFESFNLIHHGVKLVVEAFLDSIKGFNGVASASKLLSEAQREAVATTKNEVIELNALYAVAKNTSLTYSQRQAAIDKLNKSYPELHKNLKLETIGNEDTAAAISKVVENLVNEAKAKSLLAKITDYSNALDIAVQTAKKINIGPLARGNEREIIRIQKLISDTTKDIEKLYAETLTATDGKSMGDLGKVFGDVKVPNINIKPDKLAVEPKSLEVKFSGRLTEFEDYYNKALRLSTGSMNDILASKIQKSQEATLGDLSQIGGAFQNVLIRNNAIISAGIDAQNERWRIQADLISQTLSPAFDGFITAVLEKQDALKSFFQAIGQSVKQLIRQLIEAALRAAVLSLFGGGISTVGGGVIKGFGNLFKHFFGFASGGLVTGPVSAVVGEGPGTSRSNPEVVAPLDKLHNFFADITGFNRTISTGNMGMAGMNLALPREVILRQSGRDMIGVIELERRSQGLTG